VTRKKGFSGFLGKHFTCDDAHVLDLDDSWFYSWLSNPWGQYSKCNDREKLPAEFVPMIIGLGSYKEVTDTKIRWWKEANVRFLLGYNEPDYGNGHNHPHMMDPADAAKEWPKIQEIAAQFDPPLTLVSPAISSKGPDALDANGGSIWLDYFFGNCSEVVPDCDVDLIKYVAFHDYQGDADKLMARMEGGFKKYKRPIWLTEFGVMNWDGPTPTRQEHDDYLREVIPMLEASEAVYRYAWFTARQVPNAGEGESSLLPYDSDSLELTSTGKVYSQRESSIIAV
jgi:hypothetical protein